MVEFPHLPGAPEFPESGRNLYEQIPGAFDYTAWQEGAEITLLSVPWGVYDPAIMLDRPGFDTVEERERWFDAYIAQTATETHVLNTRVRYQIDDYVDVPFTFDYAARYNYLRVVYPDAPVSYGRRGMRTWYYHVTDIRYGSPSSTTLMLVPDWWTIAAPLMDISHMILARGHAPMTLTDVDSYLDSPLAESAALLAADIDYGTGTVRVASSHDEVINDGTVYAVLCLSGVTISGAADYVALPFDNSTFVQGVPSDIQYAVPASELPGFLDAWAENAPATMQALEALYFCGSKLLAFDTSVELWGFTVLTGARGTSYTAEFELSRDSFGYPERYADLAKLYTFPYARIEVSDDVGNVTEVRIEELSTGTVRADIALNGAFPWLKVSAHIEGVAGARKTLSFRTAQAHEFAGGGRWYDTLKSWDVPCFSIHQSAAQAYDYRTHWSRVQQAANAATARTNALASNATAKTNADNVADNMVANNLINTTANTSVVDTSNEYTQSNNYEAQMKMERDCNADVETSKRVTQAQNEAIALAATVNVATGAAHAITGLVTGGLSGDLTAIGAGGTVADGVISAVSANASSAISQSSNEALMNAAIGNARGKKNNAQMFTEASVDNQTASASDINDIRNTAATQATANNSNLTKTNASNTKATADANAQRSYDNAIAAIANTVREAALQAPLSFGRSSAGEFANTRPMVLSINIVTESQNAIAQAGAQFLRYGYAYNQPWDWTTWNMRTHFTYWQVSDIWATGVDNVPEEGQDAVRRMLYDGVTVWKDPQEIGRVGIYG